MSRDPARGRSAPTLARSRWQALPQPAQATCPAPSSPKPRAQDSQPADRGLPLRPDKILAPACVARATRRPGRTRASLARREGFGDDSHVRITSTLDDRRRWYSLDRRCLGVQLDGVTDEGGDDDYSYDTIWESEGLTPFGYVVWMALLQEPEIFGLQEQQWGGRTVTSGGTTRPRSRRPTPRRIASVGQQLATASGVQQISSGRKPGCIRYRDLHGRPVPGRFPAGVRHQHRRTGRHRQQDRRKGWRSPST